MQNYIRSVFSRKAESDGAICKLIYCKARAGQFIEGLSTGFSFLLIVIVRLILHLAMCLSVTDMFDSSPHIRRGSLNLHFFPPLPHEFGKIKCWFQFSPRSALYSSLVQVRPLTGISQMVAVMREELLLSREELQCAVAFKYHDKPLRQRLLWLSLFHR